MRRRDDILVWLEVVIRVDIVVAEVLIIIIWIDLVVVALVGLASEDEFFESVEAADIVSNCRDVVLV